MKIVRSLLLVVLVAPALVVVGASSALACSCVPPQPDRKAVKDAAAVFAGTVVDIEDGVKIGFDEVTWTFAVDTVYKGDVGALQEIHTHTQGAACGVIFKEQKRYVVFAHQGSPTGSKGDGLATNSCMNTRELGDDQTLKLQAISRFDPSDSRDGPSGSGGGDAVPVAVVIGAVGVAVFVLSGTMAWLIRRRKNVA